MPGTLLCKKIFLLFLCAVLTGCRATLLNGTFIGSYTDFRLDNPTTDTVWITLESATKNSATKSIQIKNVRENESPVKIYSSMALAPSQGLFKSFGKRFDFRLFDVNSTQEPLVFQLVKVKQTASQKIFDTQCYQGRSAIQPSQALICVNDGDLSIAVHNSETGAPLLTIVGNRFTGTDEKVKYEEPRTFTLDEAIKTGLGQAAEILIENQVVFRARHSNHAGWNGLLPHISFSSHALIGGASPSLGLIDFLGDLAPFLFPAHWIRAMEGSLKVKIELDAARIIRLNLVKQIQDLTYLYNRDKANFRQCENIINHWINDVIPAVKRLEALNLMPLDSTKLLLTYYNQASEDLKVLHNLIQNDLYALSLTLGFLNPQAITDIGLGPEEDYTAIDSATTCDEPQELGTQGYRVSIERRQLHTAKRLAIQGKNELYFNWFDPDGGPETALGGGLLEQFKIARSNIYELELKDKILQKSIFNASAIACNNYNRSLNSYMRVRRIRIERQELFNKQVSDLREAENSNKKFTTPTQDFAESFQNLLKALEDLAASVGNYRLNRTQLQRILLTGRFRQVLLPEQGEIPPPNFQDNHPFSLNFLSLQNESLEKDLF